VQLEDIKILPDRPRPCVYPPRYRIPQSTISKLHLQEQVWRSEKFALGTLLYELLTGRTIIEGEFDDMVRDHNITGIFPSLTELPSPWPYVIYSCWSAEFGRYIVLGKFRRYIHDNPLHIAGGAFSTAALFTVPILGVIGFSAIGPVAGSAAAAWQASIGVVQAGSLFAFCQSVAMGDATTIRLGAAGAAGVFMIPVWGADSGLPSLDSLQATFVRNFRT